MPSRAFPGLQVSAGKGKGNAEDEPDAEIKGEEGSASQAGGSAGSGTGAGTGIVKLKFKNPSTTTATTPTTSNPDPPAPTSTPTPNSTARNRTRKPQPPPLQPGSSTVPPPSPSTKGKASPGVPLFRFKDPSASALASASAGGSGSGSGSGGGNAQASSSSLPSGGGSGSGIGSAAGGGVKLKLSLGGSALASGAGAAASTRKPGSTSPTIGNQALSTPTSNGSAHANPNATTGTITSTTGGGPKLKLNFGGGISSRSALTPTPTPSTSSAQPQPQIPTPSSTGKGKSKAPPPPIPTPVSASQAPSPSPIARSKSIAGVGSGLTSLKIKGKAKGLGEGKGRIVKPSPLGVGLSVGGGGGDGVGDGIGVGTGVERELGDGGDEEGGEGADGEDEDRDGEGMDIDAIVATETTPNNPAEVNGSTEAKKESEGPEPAHPASDAPDAANAEYVPEHGEFEDGDDYADEDADEDDAEYTEADLDTDAAPSKGRGKARSQGKKGKGKGTGKRKKVVMPEVVAVVPGNQQGLGEDVKMEEADGAAEKEVKVEQEDGEGMEVDGVGEEVKLDSPGVAAKEDQVDTPMEGEDAPSPSESNTYTATANNEPDLDTPSSPTHSQTNPKRPSRHAASLATKKLHATLLHKSSPLQPPRKKKLSSILNTVMGMMKKRDQYGLFLEPVSLEEYPEYYEVIGGRERAMDLRTMEEGVEAGRYRSLDEFEADVNKIVTAAQIFNPDDPVVHKEAAKISQIAEMQLNKWRDLVRTPSPTPEVDPFRARWSAMPGMTSGFGTPGEMGTPDDMRSASPGVPGEHPLDRASRLAKREVYQAIERPAVEQLQPRSVVPVQMLEYPANTDIARCVGYYLTGGKRYRNKKESRAKEKWDGQWREWFTEGDRNLREAEDVLALVNEGFTSQDQPGYIGVPMQVDWKDEAMNAKEVWQPTPFLTGMPVEEVVPVIPKRMTSHLDYGRFQDLPGQYKLPEFKAWEQDRLTSGIRDEIKAKREKEATLELGWENPVKFLREVAVGDDLASEAYLRSLKRFVGGASRAAEEEARGRKRKAEEAEQAMEVDENPDVDAVKTDGEEAEDPAEVPAGFDLGMSLKDYVSTQWRGGFVSGGMRGTISKVHEAYFRSSQAANAPPSKRPRLDSDEALDDLAQLEQEIFNEITKTAITRVTQSKDLYIAGYRGDGLNLSALLYEAADFVSSGNMGGPPPHAAGRAAWYEDALRTAGRELLDAWRRREGMRKEELEGEEELARMKRMRLNLLSLAKNVPVYELRPMTVAESEKLPQAVRGLIKIIK